MNVRRLRRKLKKNLNNANTFFLLGILLGLFIGFSLSSLNSTEKVAVTSVASASTYASAANISGELIFKNICMKCHTTPTKFKSFTTYFGKPASVWRIGVQKMIAVGNVQLSEKEIEAVTEYLEKKFK